MRSTASEMASELSYTPSVHLVFRLQCSGPAHWHCVLNNLSLRFLAFLNECVYTTRQ